ncbi:transcriptional regulator BetI [Halovibrio salipaludis]|uniref:HTH-type transcriptional regulator BetI n=1 Tax=Halovibrio salipaludis TaxID=2032626 RepID=A0A2A2FAV2_9GAMM|nr:transcriptional regulator BetI [Halovibrio salipaludis]PAU81854.1 transcriptional regulator BetI [Halovibrio salipaludis]
MPKVGVQEERRRQLIEATLEVVGELGLQSATIGAISRTAGMSSGLISHYFGGKQALIEATLRQLLEELKLALIEHTGAGTLTPQQRLVAIVEANFSDFQRSTAATRTWLSFWARAMHEPGLARLQHINNRRLYSNLCYSFRQLLPVEAARSAAKQTAALIDGFWLRSALWPDQEEGFRESEKLCQAFINDILTQHGVEPCH